MKRGYRVLLGPRILSANEPRPQDYENYLASTVCYAEIPIYQVEPDATIKNVVETNESPFEQRKFYSESIPSRSSPAGKKLTSKRKRNKTKLHDDPEISELMRIYGVRVKVVHDTNS